MKKYNSKVLLFGEYTVIDGGQAIAIPFDKFNGYWLRGSDKSNLIGFFEYLFTLEGYNSALVKKAIDQNWVFKSTILQGYGAGSSGALTAAAYDSFFIQIPSDLKLVQNQLSLTESYFHGKSSGLDPLTSFYNVPVLINEDKPHLLTTLKLPRRFYLYDSESTRNTKALVQDFFIKKKNNEKFNAVLKSLNQLNDLAINALQFSPSSLDKVMKQISLLQFEHFSSMIPAHVKKIWLNGIRNDNYYMKLSGAGGGGYFLLYAKRRPDLNLIFPIS